jgi:hypothetical protein
MRSEHRSVAKRPTQNERKLIHDKISVINVIVNSKTIAIFDENAQFAHKGRDLHRSAGTILSMMVIIVNTL